MSKVIFIFLGVFMVLLIAGFVYADTFNVPTEAYPTIQAGIDAASDTDTVLVANGTFTGSGNVNLDFGGRAITVKSENGADNCIIDCESASNTRGFYFHNGEASDSVLEGFTIMNGSMTGSYGGGIFCDGAGPTIKNCIIKNNTANLGGGIYGDNSSSAYILSCLISGNTGNSGGGGIGCEDSSTFFMSHSTIADNTGSSGGGLYCYGSSTMTVYSSILWNNTSDQAYLNSSTLDISYSDVQDGQSGVTSVSGSTLTWGDGNIDDDPLFGSYSLTDYSPCIGGGTLLITFPDKDVAGNDRPNPAETVPDMGAYENSRNTPKAQTITVLSPNGGTDFKGGVSTDITWSGDLGPSVDHIKILYSTDSGVTYPDTAIASTPNDGTYSWTLPAIDFDTVRVKTIAEDSGNNEIVSDTSDSDFTIDITTPTTNINLTGTQGDNSWWTTDVQVTLSATDNLTGVDVTKYRINSGAWQDYSVPFMVTGSTVDYYSEDNVANVESTKSQEIKIDKTAPSPAPVVTDDGDVTTSTTQLHATWTASGDGESGVVDYQYAIGTTPGGTDTRNWTSVGNVTEITATSLTLANRETYYFGVKAKNGAGLISSVGQSDGIKVNSGAITINVPADYPTIQAAIDASFDEDTVSVANGTYKGAGNVNLDFKGKVITVKSVNGAANCIIDCESTNNTRGFYFHSGEGLDSLLEGFTIMNGLIPTWYGGGIYCNGTSPTIKNCIIKNSVAKWGGGIGCENGSTASILSCLIFGNTATTGGGGVGCEDALTSLTLINNTITENTGAQGGGLFCYGTATATVTNTILWNNATKQVYLSNSTLNISYSDVQDGQSGVSSAGTSTVNWGSGNINEDPYFGSYHLLDYSPCIGAGTSSVAFPNKDIAGNNRPNPAGTDPDIGAYENSRSEPLSGDMQLTSPNGGEKLKGGTSTNVTWTVSSLPGIDHIRLLYSTDSGVTYPNTIIASTPNDGTQSWTLPTIDSGTVQVKVVAEDSGNTELMSDTSNGDFMIDSTLPVTNISLDGTQGENNWWTTDVQVTLSASDNLAGIKNTKYRINSGAWQNYTVPFNVTGSTVNYYSEDNVSNIEATKSQEIKIDKTAPSPAPVVTDDGTQTASKTQLHATWTASSDAGSGVAEYQYAIGTTLGGIDVRDWTSAGTATEVTATGLSLINDQIYYFAVKAKNGAGLFSAIGNSNGITAKYGPSTIYVPTNYPTIQAAIDASASGDTIVVLNDTYKGVGNVNLDFKGKAIIVKSQNGPTNCIIDCENIAGRRGFYFHNGEGTDSVVDGFTIKNGKVMGDFPIGTGGGILCAGSSPSILNNIITGCTVQTTGGAIFCYVDANPVIRFNKLTGNSADTGAAIRCTDSAPIIDGNTIQNNTARATGGISCAHMSSPVITNNIIQNNKGTAISCHYYSNATIKNNLITGHTASPAGAINVGAINIQESSSPVLVSNTISGNTGTYAGSLYIVGDSDVTMIDNILWGNNPIEIYMGELPGGASSVMEIELEYGGGSVISNHLSTAASVLTASYCDVKGGRNAIVTASGDTVNWGDGNIDSNPLFTNFHLSDTSPCIGKGTMTAAVPTTDLEGKTRPTPSGSNPDIGAYENDREEALGQPVIVTSPKGGEKWAGETTKNITWTTTGLPTLHHIRLLYSTDGGSTYPNLIVASTPNDGTHPWTLPSITSTTVKVKAIAENSSNVELYSDTSNTNFTIDITGPTTPVVTDDGDTTSSTTQLHATWTVSTDPETGITGYHYAIGTTPGGTDTKDWASAGLSHEVTATGLNLKDGKTYYFGVKTINVVGIWSEVGVSNGIKVVEVGLRVPTQYPTIQKAIDAAVNGGQVIVLDGTYKGVGNVNLDFKGKAITVKSQNGPTNCIIDCQNNSRGFYFHNGEGINSVVNGFTIKNGKVMGDFPVGTGGGIRCDGSSPSILNNIITGCTVQTTGGAIFCYVDANPVIRFNTLTGNTADTGAAIRCTDSSPTIDSNTIQNNTGNATGGISCAQMSSPVITNNIIQNNKGMAISCHYFSNATIKNNLITGHAGVSAGAINVGAINIQESSSPVLVSNTISGNTGAYAGSLYIVGNSDVTMIDNILWGNNPIEIYMGELPGGASSVMEIELEYGYGSVISNHLSIAASVLTASYCDVKGGRNAIVTASGDTINWAVNNIDKDPLFENFHLSDFSPCIGKGNMTAEVPTTDLGGKARPTPAATAPDIGVYENDRGQPLEGFITVKKPNGGELLKGGTSYNITWETLGAGIDHIKLLYSTDSGATYPNVIIASTPNDGAHSWTLPSITSSKVRVKGITENSSNIPISSDVSDGDFTIDSSGPTKPVVTDDGQYTNSTNKLHAWWSTSTDAESGVVEYQYSIGTTKGGTDTRNWTSVGLNTEVIATSLSLTNGKTYYFNVKAKNGLDIWSDVGSSDGIVVNTALEQIEISLYEGMNLISIPITPSSTNLTTLLGPIQGLFDSVYAYSANPGWQRYIPGSTNNTLTTIEAGRAYCIDMKEDAKLLVTGTKITTTNIQLLEGLNLVGYNSLRTQNRADALSSIDANLVYIYTYDNVTRKWTRYVKGFPGFLNENVSLDQLNPKAGYWISVSNNSTWTVAP